MSQTDREIIIEGVDTRALVRHLRDHGAQKGIISTEMLDRVELAAQADFVLCFYNPASKKRADYLKRACELILKHRSPDTPCGYVRNIGREGQEAHVMTLRELQDAQVDMFTTVFVGNSQTRRIGDKLVTPRGYKNV